MSLLENSFSDLCVAPGRAESHPILGYIVDGRLDPDRLKAALIRVMQHFPVLTARMRRNGTDLTIPDQHQPCDLFSWTFEDHEKPLSAVFTPPPQPNGISISRRDTRARSEFYIPLAMTVGHSSVDERPLIIVRVQRFLDKTVIGLAWNHFLTDGAGMAVILSSWSMALKGDLPLPEVASKNDPFPSHYVSNPTHPSGTVHPRLLKVFQFVYAMMTETLCYGPPEPRSIFIPISVIHSWKSACPVGISTNDLITAWLIKAWASTATSGVLSVYTVMDLRKHLPKIVPPTYLRNASSARPSPYTMQIKDINKMSQFDVAKTVNSLVKHFTPDVEMNHQSFEFMQGGKGFQMLPEANRIFAISSISAFNFPQIDFGAKTESFETFRRAKRDRVNIGTICLESGGARISFWMSKRRWDMGIWKTLSKF